MPTKYSFRRSFFPDRVPDVLRMRGKPYRVVEEETTPLDPLVRSFLPFWRTEDGAEERRAVFSTTHWSDRMILASQKRRESVRALAHPGIGLDFLNG
jgi:hypothetical protein